MAQDEYTMTRISKEYLEKLRKIADKEKRTMAKMIEVLIDEREKKK